MSSAITSDTCPNNNHRHEPYWEYDARGIPLVLVCSHCRAGKLATYRKDVLDDPNYEADEEIEPDDDWDVTGRGPEPLLDWR